MRLISSARAYAIASQWGSFNDASDPGACLYAFHFQDGRPQSDQHRSDCLLYLRSILNQGGSGSMSARSERDLRSLIRYLANCPLRPVSPAMVPQQAQQQQGQAASIYIETRTLAGDVVRRHGPFPRDSAQFSNAYHSEMSAGLGHNRSRRHDDPSCQRVYIVTDAAR